MLTAFGKAGSNPYPIGDLSSASIATVQEMQILDFGKDESGYFPVIVLLATLSGTGNSHTSSEGCCYPSNSYYLDSNTSSAFAGGPATIIMSVDLTDANDPTILEVDRLNANSNQN